MSFQSPVTVETVLRGIQSGAYVLPAIQREFVWRPDQIVALVDSLMRGYPVGSFLMWNVQPETAQNYQFYGFITNYHAKNNPYAQKSTVPPGTGVTAVLDGQQRLTSLNIALFGSYAEKKKGAWSSNLNAYPKKHLYLNLASDADHEELGLRYDLRFLDDSEAKPRENEADVWFKVGDVLRLKDSGPALISELTRRGLTADEKTHGRLWTLYNAIRILSPINYFIENDQSGDKVLDIFVRVNSGGTTLSYSDLLLSMATNQWTGLDAREEVRSLVDDINSGGSRDFGFSKDVVLKSALMIADLNLGFRVANFTRENMARVEQEWDSIRESLVGASALLSIFGYNRQTLSADSVIIPLAYYLSKQQDRSRVLASSEHAGNRELIRKWVARSLLKAGIWGSGLDSTLIRVRSAIAQNSSDTFPEAGIEKALGGVGKSLRFDEGDIDELLDSAYGSKRTFVLLSLLYPGLDFSKQFHQDHVFPKSRFTPKRLAAAGISSEAAADYREKFNLLPNLQILEGTPNIEKQDSMPADWLISGFADDAKRTTYIDANDLPRDLLTMEKFADFYSWRREHMRTRLNSLLTTSPPESTQ